MHIYCPCSSLETLQGCRRETTNLYRYGFSNPRRQPNQKGSSRGSGFTHLEDEAIEKAWIAASEDPIVGADQKGPDFYKSIQSVYNVKFKPVNREERSVGSLKNRCRAIHKECMAFGGCYKRVVRSHPTGVSPADIVNMATPLYNGVELQSASDDFGKHFKYLDAWKVLKQHPKFALAEDGKTPNNKVITREGSFPSNENGSGNYGSGGSDDAGGMEGSVRAAPKERYSVYKEERPIGGKRAKMEKEKREESLKKLKL